MYNPEIKSTLVNTPIENISGMESGEIARALGRAEKLASTIKEYQAIIRFCDEKGIRLEGRTPLTDLLYPEGDNGTDSSVLALTARFEAGILDIKNSLADDSRILMEEALSQNRF